MLLFFKNYIKKLLKYSNNKNDYNLMINFKSKM